MAQHGQRRPGVLGVRRVLKAAADEHEVEKYVLKLVERVMEAELFASEARAGGGRYSSRLSDAPVKPSVRPTCTPAPADDIEVVRAGGATEVEHPQLSVGRALERVREPELKLPSSVIKRERRRRRHSPALVLDGGVDHGQVGVPGAAGGGGRLGVGAVAADEVVAQPSNSAPERQQAGGSSSFARRMIEGGKLRPKSSE